MSVHNLIDLTGQRFGRLLVLRQVAKAAGHLSAKWLCRCDCEQHVVVMGLNLRRGRTQSCGCFRRAKMRTHGMYQTRTYRIWAGMIQRCRNPHNEKFADYGGRGITVCQRWHSFENFLADMGDAPQGKSIDRYPNNDGNYEPGNCRWATQEQQCNNTRKNRKFSYQGEMLSVGQLARRFNLPHGRLWNRLMAGLTVNEAVTRPVQERAH